MQAYDFRESLGDNFGSLINSGLGVVKEVGEHQLKRLETKNAAQAQYGVGQQPVPVQSTGEPVQQTERIAGVKKSTLLFGVGLLTAVGFVVAGSKLIKSK